jgi:hypothetical protein
MTRRQRIAVWLLAWSIVVNVAHVLLEVLS